MSKIKRYLDKYNLKNFNRLKLFEKIISIACIIICFILMLNVAMYTQLKIRNTAFTIKNQEVDNSYNLLAEKLTNIGYTVNMVLNEDDTYSIIATCENGSTKFNVDVRIDENGTILENAINTRLLLTTVKDEKYKFDRGSTEIFGYYIMFNKTLNLFQKTIDLEDFQTLVSDAHNYDTLRHGCYESEDNIYEIYKETRYIYLKMSLKQKSSTSKFY